MRYVHNILFISFSKTRWKTVGKSSEDKVPESPPHDHSAIKNARMRTEILWKTDKEISSVHKLLSLSHLEPAVSGKKLRRWKISVDSLRGKTPRVPDLGHSSRRNGTVQKIRGRDEGGRETRAACRCGGTRRVRSVK